VLGFGNIGRRHIQSLSEDDMFDIYCVDPAQYKTNSPVKIYETVERLIEKTQINFFDICIVATQASKREDIIRSLFKSCKIDSLVLEKPVFQNWKSYSLFSKFFINSETSVWVNTVFRNLECFQRLKKLTNSPLTITAHGNWDFCSNFSHYLDLFLFLNNDIKHDVKNCTSELYDILYSSKRPGCFEAKGSISINFENDSKITLSTENKMSNGDNHVDLLISCNSKNLLMSIRGEVISAIRDDFGIYDEPKSLISYPFVSVTSQLNCKAIYEKRYENIKMANYEKIFGLCGTVTRQLEKVFTERGYDTCLIS